MLVPVQPAELDDFAVQLETMVGELDSRKPMERETSSATCVHATGGRARCKLGVLQIPKLDGAQVSRCTLCTTGSPAGAEGGTRCIPFANT